MVNNINLDDPLHADGMPFDAAVVRIAGRDVLLDLPERRKSATPPLRRALTHDQEDGLTINFAVIFRAA